MIKHGAAADITFKERRVTQIIATIAIFFWKPKWVLGLKMGSRPGSTSENAGSRSENVGSTSEKAGSTSEKAGSTSEIVGSTSEIAGSTSERVGYASKSWF